MYEKLKTACEKIQSIHRCSPRVGLVLGSGLGAYVDRIDNAHIIDYAQIPYFHETTVEGHNGRLILGEVQGVSVAVLQGRIHAYEGHPMEDVVFPIRVLATLGIETLLLTNAAGGLNPDFKPGDLVMINDHINFQGLNPLVGPNINELGPRFPDMTQAYHPHVQEAIKKAAVQVDFPLKEGVYAAVLGPTYETPAEVRMLRALGADMVGMSTVPESIAANHLGLKVGGISCITNMAAGMGHEKLKHEDVKKEALRVMEVFTQLLTDVVKELAQ